MRTTFSGFVKLVNYPSNKLFRNAKIRFLDFINDRLKPSNALYFLLQLTNQSNRFI